MPLDRTAKRASTSGNVEDTSARQREQELRRARGEIACIECQRCVANARRVYASRSCWSGRQAEAAVRPKGPMFFVYTAEPGGYVSKWCVAVSSVSRLSFTVV